MAFFVYILYTAEFNKFYIDQTAAVDEQLLRHNSGSEKATLPYRPWVLKWFTEKPSRAVEMQLENYCQIKMGFKKLSCAGNLKN